MSWTDDRVERLRDLHAKGETASSIARDLGGVTRCAVIGKLHRIGLYAHPNAKNRGGRIGGLKTSKSRPPFQKPISPVRAIVCDGLPLPAPAETDVPRVSWQALNENGKRHCKWPCLGSVTGVPQDQPMFCGAEPAPGLPYCPDHARRAFNVSNPLRPVSVPKRMLQVA